jgi:predicted enzyme related to lactoylglutathione lyase
MTDQPIFGAVLYAKDVSRVVAFYSAILDLLTIERADNYVVLQSGGLQLVILGIPKNVAASIDITAPPMRRASTAFKPVFFVPSLTAVRATAEAFGGVLNPTDKEWSFRGSRVCDGLDPEGNVVQFRELDAKASADAPVRA